LSAVDYYALLGVDRSASRGDIKSAYRALAKTLHPDIGGTASEFHALNEAYEALTDPARRAAYDRSLYRPAPTQRQPGKRRAGGRWSPPGRRTGQTGRLRDFGEDAGFVPPPLTIDPTTLPWRNVPQRVRYLVANGPTMQRLLAAIGAWLALLLLVIWLPIDSVPLLVGLWTLVIAAAAAVARLAHRHLLAGRAERAFLTESGGRSTFGRPGTDADQVAERLTAQLLDEYLVRLPGTYIFHGLTLPGSVFADVDHAVLRGRRLVLVESKMWLPGHYGADPYGGISRNGHTFRGGNVRLTDGLPAYRKLLPGLDVRGVLVVYPSRAGEIGTDPAPDAPTPPMSPERFVREIGAWLAEEPAMVDRAAFRIVRGQLAEED
jgi:hypothetical protein